MWYDLSDKKPASKHFRGQGKGSGMENNPKVPIRIVDIHSGEWKEHPRFRGILAKALLTRADNPHANVNVVQVPPGGTITSHSHATQMETVYVLQGRSVLHYRGQEYPFSAGSLVALPAGVEHEVVNVGEEAVELLTIFTPPL